MKLYRERERERERVCFVFLLTCVSIDLHLDNEVKMLKYVINCSIKSVYLDNVFCEK